MRGYLVTTGAEKTNIAILAKAQTQKKADGVPCTSLTNELRAEMAYDAGRSECTAGEQGNRRGEPRHPPLKPHLHNDAN